MSGTRFDQAFARAVVHSQVAVPIVSVDALERLLTHNVCSMLHVMRLSHIKSFLIFQLRLPK